jgi:RND family efflux transporter MFP subunit
MAVLAAGPGLADGPVAVRVQQPVLREFTDFEDFTGRMEAVETVQVRARVSGCLAKVTFKEGTDVKKGELLFEIDGRPYQAELDRVEARLKQREAHLRRVEAEYKRAVKLRQQGAATQEELDKIAAEREEAQAYVVLARAEREVARLNLDYTRVSAAISGRIGRCLVTPGNFVKADETLLAHIDSTDPIVCIFDMDERTFLRCRSLLSDRKARATDTAVPLLAGLANEAGFPHKGTLDFIDNRVDPRTGTVRLRGRFANRDGTFLPGLFVRLRLPLGKPRKALAIPESAILQSDGKKYVLVVVDKTKKVEQRPVKPGKLLGQGDGQGELRIIEEGLKASDLVVVSGLSRVRPGDTVDPKQ